MNYWFDYRVGNDGFTYIFTCLQFSWSSTCVFIDIHPRRDFRVVFKHTENGVGGPRFYSRVSEIGRGVANSSPPLRRLFEAVLMPRR